MKVLILTDSVGLPRTFPVNEIIDLEETYPRILSKKFDKESFFQVSLAGELSEKIINHARAYLMHWQPDVIILGFGINDARPDSLYISFQEYKIFKYLTKFKWFKLLLYKIDKILFKKKTSTTKLSKFIEKINQLKSTFNSSRIMFIEISCATNYDAVRPGVIYWKNEFNKKLKTIFGSNFIKINDENNESLHLSDGLHYSKESHKLLAEKILNHLAKKN